MYDELVKRLRDAAKMSEALAVLLPHSEGNATAKLYNEAADAIESLSEDNAALNGTVTNLLEQIKELGKPRWIPVTERLPKEGEFVLVCGDLYPNKHDGGVIAVSKRMDWNYWQGFGRERNITHWMPLPQPPKEG